MNTFAMALVQWLVCLLLTMSHTAQSTSGSGSPLNSRLDLRCERDKPDPYCSIIRSTAEHFVRTTNAIDKIFETLQHGLSLANTSYECSQLIIFSACFYSYRECDDKGAQKLICNEICPLVSQLYDICVDIGVANTLVILSSNDEVKRYLKFSLEFNCSQSDSYKLEGVPVSIHTFSHTTYFTNKNIYTSLLEIEATTTSLDNDKDLPLGVKLFLGLGIPITVIVLVVVAAVCVVRLQRSKAHLERKLTEKIELRRDEYEPNIHECEEIKLSSEEKCFYEERFEKAVFPIDHLQIKETVGEGNFGIVCKAVHLPSSQHVAVKMVKSLTSKQKLRSLLNESLLMKRFDHPNIVGLLGVCLDTPEGYPYLILPYMPKGNLQDYLKEKRVYTTGTISLSERVDIQVLTGMCLDIAKGMEYLSKNKFVHRDLAARNCLIDEEGVVKVGDFGLAKDVYAHLYYRGDKHSEIPVKWSAPETLTDGLSTEMSDVWSFGVVCWEVFSLGATPYPGVNNYDILHYIMSGKRLSRPPICPQHIYELMEKCWKIAPEDRIAFNEFVTMCSSSSEDNAEVAVIV